MKRFMIGACCLLSGATVVLAGDFKAGVFGGYTMGGDISEEDFAYGAQVVYNITDAFSAELAVSRLKDEASESEMGIHVSGDVDITPITLSARYAIPILEDKLRCYGLAGIGYYMYDASIDVDMSGAAAAVGIPGLTASGSADLEIDDTFGYHVGAGVEWKVHENVELFAEYRYAFVKPGATIEGTATASYRGRTVSEDFEEDLGDDNYDVGLLRVGVNYLF